MSERTSVSIEGGEALHHLVAALVGIELLKGEYLKENLIEVINLVYPSVSLLETTRRVGNSVSSVGQEVARYHFLFEQPEEAVEFKLKYAEFFS